MKKFSAFLLATQLFFTQAVFACDTASLIPIFQTNETKTLLENAPTFKHAWQDKTILLSLQADPNQACNLMMQLNIPQQDIDEAKQHLDANPAKRILLAAQGYALPESNQQQLTIALNQQGELTENNPALKQLHSNLEYMYQLLAQLRTEILPNQTNTTAWPNAQKQTLLDECNAKHSNDSGCNCRLNAFEKTINPKQMELITFIEQQPYSKATGALASFVAFDKQTRFSCGLN